MRLIKFLLALFVIFCCLTLLSSLQNQKGFDPDAIRPVPDKNFLVLPGVEGPLEKTLVQPSIKADWHDSTNPSPASLAVLLTDEDSEWLALAHGLKTIGIPFTITNDYKEALKHRVVFVYPYISGKVLSSDALFALGEHVKNGALLAQNVWGGGLQGVFGFNQAFPIKDQPNIRIDESFLENGTLTDKEDLTIHIGTAKSPTIGAHFYTDPANKPLAIYDDGKAAFVQNAAGNAAAIGVDVGYLLSRGYNNRQESISRTYVNGYEPSIDTLLRIIKNFYIQHEPLGVTIGTVPEGKNLSVVLTHDIDYTQSAPNALVYASLEKKNDVKGTYFIQVKYIADWNDDIIFTDKTIQNLERLREMGMEIASHTVCHSKLFSRFKMGTGEEKYPTYKPFVKDRFQAFNGSILGETRVSKFLLERFLPQLSVASFRPGHLSDPYALPQVLTATGYRFSSSVTANDSLTHLPFQLTYNRKSSAETPIFEFPITLEDEDAPPMIARLSQALLLADKIKRYGGLFVVLIHPDIVGDKFEFEKRFIEEEKNSAWFGSLQEFGEWWSARDKIKLEVIDTETSTTIRLNAIEPIRSLPLFLPKTLKPKAARSDATFKIMGNYIILDKVSGQVDISFKRVP